MKNDTNIIIGSRGSQLALWQAHWVQREIKEHFPAIDVEIQIIKTTGDAVLDSPLSAIGDKGLFTKEIEVALLNGSIDLAVHSLKDLPTVLPEGLRIGAITKREDVRDVFICHPNKPFKSLDDVPKGGTIATGSLRRRSQLLNRRPDLKIIDLRGNLNTRFAKLESSDWDGMILARAGVVRLEMASKISEVIPVDRMLPAVGQGALGIEVRIGDKRIEKFLQSLHSTAAEKSTSCERAFLRFLEGGCQVPIGAYARIENNELLFDAVIGSIDGKKIVRGKVKGNADTPEELGKHLAKTLFESGGKEILDGIRNAQPLTVG